jgi:hypothetical protein
VDLSLQKVCFPAIPKTFPPNVLLNSQLLSKPLLSLSPLVKKRKIGAYRDENLWLISDNYSLYCKNITPLVPTINHSRLSRKLPIVHHNVISFEA